MWYLSKHSETGYYHACDELTGLCGIVNPNREVVVPLEMEHIDNVWEHWSYDSTRARFIVFYKEDKAGFLFHSFFKGDRCYEPVFDEWCYYRGILSMREGDKYYNLDNIQAVEIVEVPRSWTAMYKREQDEERGEVINKKYMLGSDSPFVFTLAPTYEDKILNRLFNEYMLIEKDGKFNYKNADGVLMSEKWFDDATNFDEYNHATIIYKGKEFLIEGTPGGSKNLNTALSIVLLSKVTSGENDFSEAFKYLNEIDDFI